MLQIGDHDLAYSWVSISPMLAKCALATTQSGAGSTYAALSEGVPVAVWPTTRNHEILGNFVQRAEAGMSFDELSSLGADEALHGETAYL